MPQINHQSEPAASSANTSEKRWTLVFLSHWDWILYRFRLPVMEDLSGQGHRVIALCPRGDYFRRFGEHGVEAVDYTIERKSLHPFRELASLKAIRRRLLEIRPDILHAFAAKPNIYGALAGKAAKVPVVLMTVTGLGSYFIGSSPKDLLVRQTMVALFRRACRRADGVLFQNAEDRQFFVSKHLVAAEKTHLVRGSGVREEEFDPRAISEETKDKYRRELGLDGRRCVLMVARAIWHKGLREYAQAAEKLRESHPDVKCLFVGGTDEGNPSCANANWLKTQAFDWLGERSDIPQLMAVSDIVTLPSYREGLPRTLLEAAMMGKPMVATAAVGCREIVIDGETGLLAPLHNGAALADCISRLLADEALRTRLGQNARQLALSEFTAASVSRQYQQIYHQLSGKIADQR